MYDHYLCRKAKCLELIILYYHLIFRIYINSTSDRINCMLCQSLTTKLVTFCAINSHRVRKRLTSPNSKPEWQNKILVGIFDVLLWLIDQRLRRLCLFRSLFTWKYSWIKTPGTLYSGSHEFSLLLSSSHLIRECLFPRIILSWSIFSSFYVVSFSSSLP